MSHCWGEGELRAWIDGELPPEQAVAVERHLSECAECAGAHRVLADRAARVSAWMGDLAADAPAPLRAPAPRPESVRPVAWAGIAALAAALVMGVLMLRHPDDRPVPVAVGHAPAAVVTPPAQEDSAPVTTVAATPAVRARRTPVKPVRATPVQYYMALDEEPIDTGLVMRVALPSGMQADVIVDGDGRARAIRPIQAVLKEDER